jgi:hypothetical protein
MNAFGNYMYSTGIQLSTPIHSKYFGGRGGFADQLSHPWFRVRGTQTETPAYCLKHLNVLKKKKNLFSHGVDLWVSYDSRNISNCSPNSINRPV